MKYITSAVTGERKETITIATEKRLQDLMKREHQSNEAKFLTWALKEYKCIKGCGSASIKEIRKYAAQEDWLRNDFGFDTDGYMIETSSAMNIRFSDYMSYWCRFCYSSLNIKDFNGLVKAIYDMTDEYGYISYPEAEQTEVEETVEQTETETVETEVAEKFIIYVSDDDLNVFCAKVFVGTVKELDDECDRIIAETNCEECLHVLCYTDKRWEWVQKHYNQVSKSALSVVVRKTETAEQETVEGISKTETTIETAEEVIESAEETTAPEAEQTEVEETDDKGGNNNE